MAKKPDKDFLGKEFEEIATSKDIWTKDFSLTLFRKKLKIIGEKIQEWFFILDDLIEEKIKEVLSELDNKTTSLGNNLGETNKEIVNIKKDIADFKKIAKESINILTDDVKILTNNQKTIVEVINKIITDPIVIDEINGGSAIE